MRVKLLALASALAAMSLLMTSIASADVVTDATLSFTATTGGPTPTGSWSFDDTTQSFVSFTVSWDGGVTHFESLARNPSVPVATNGTWCAAAFAAPQPTLCGLYSLDQLLMDGIGGGVVSPESFTDIHAMGQGTYTLASETTFNTPEPSTLTLFGTAMAGLGCGYALRKRRRDVLRSH